MKISSPAASCTRFFIVISIALSFVGCRQQKFDVIILNAVVYDGSGKPSIKTDVGINKDTIAFVGDLSDAEAPEIIDATGLVLAPGFIDAHSHHDRGFDDNREVIGAVSQGITTVIVGQDGGSFMPLKKFFQHLSDSPVAVNVGSYSGHNTLRDHVMGNDFKRVATPAEIAKMAKGLRDDMEHGALGLSTGLEYDPGIYSHKDEVRTLARILSEYGGRYISHIRSEDRFFYDAVNEVIDIGRDAKVPVQISHIKLAMRDLWGKADSTIQILEKARAEGVNVTADIYPYAYWSSTIRVLFPERNFNDLREAEFILREVTSPEGIIFSSYGPNPEYNGESLADAAMIEKKTPAAMLIELIRRLDECEELNTDCGGSIVATSMEEADIQKLMQWSQTGICSDGSSSGRHPRGYGAFTRILAKYVRDDKVLTMEEAIRKMTSLNAKSLGIDKRGSIRPGYFADLVLFDAATVKDESTIADPQKISSGIKRVWVNGVAVYVDDHATGKFPGQVILRNSPQATPDSYRDHGPQ